MTDNKKRKQIQGIVSADLNERFHDLARFREFYRGRSEKGAISLALTEAMLIWLGENEQYRPTDNYI